MPALAAPDRSAGPLKTDDRDAINLFRELLLKHGFAGDAVLASLGATLPHDKFHLREDLPLYLRRLKDRPPSTR